MAAEAPEPERIELDFCVTGQGFGVVDWLTDDGVVYEVPCFLTQSTKGDPVFMHWFNTKIRSFPNMPYADHIDYQSENGKVGVQVEPDLLQSFRDNHYPEEVWHIIDPASVKWLGFKAVQSIDEELEALQGDDGTAE